MLFDKDKDIQAELDKHGKRILRSENWQIRKHRKIYGKKEGYRFSLSTQDRKPFLLNNYMI